MRHFSLLFVLFILSSTAGFAQKITLTGKVTDSESKFPLEAATVYLSAVADSTMLDYTITDKSGNFSLITQSVDRPVFLKVSFTGYDELKISHDKLTENKQFGTLGLMTSAVALGEVVIKSEAPPVRIKNDTLEFNASSFKLRPDANVEALLKQLPGVEIDAEGKITVNGKEVNQILVNGKPFFDKDGKIALQNLPSDIINKVQVTDSKTKKEELAGQTAASNDASINLTIDEDKNKGLFGKFMGGYGTDERYESSLLINYFKDKQKVSILGSSNNINSTGFSMNEIFDSMGGGRNSSIYMSDNGGFGINGMRFGGGNGITQSNMIGVNYADQWFKDFDTNSSYFYTSANTENVNRSKQVNLLPEGEFTTESNSVTSDDKFAHNMNMDFEFKLDSTSTVYFNPKFVKANSKFKRQSDEFSIDEDGTLLNDNTSDNFDETDSQTFSSNLYVNKALKKKGRMLNFGFDNENKKDLAMNLNRSTTNFYADSDDDGNPETTSDVRNQLRQNDIVTDSYSFDIDYQEPLKDSLSVKIGANYNYRNIGYDDRTADFDPTTGQYTNENALLSRTMESRTQTIGPWAGFNIGKKAYNVNVSFGTDITKFENRGLYLGNVSEVNKVFLLPAANVNLNYKFTKSMAIYGYYQYSVDMPTANQILAIPDLTNALSTVIGNPDLDPNKYHYVYVSFRDYDFATKSGYNFYAGGSLYDSQVVTTTLFDESRKRTTSYENVGGTNFLWGGVNWNKSVKKEAHSYKYGVGINTNFNKSKGFTEGELWEASTIRISPRINFTYDYGELLTINPTYSVTFNQSKYENYLIDQASAVSHRINLQTTSYWPKHVVFGNDFGYTYNSNIADGFKKDFYLWNMSLGYNFFKDKLLAKVKVYDMLNQNQSTSRTISATTIRDEENIVLQRYAMFSLTYKLEKFGGKKKESSNFFMH